MSAAGASPRKNATSDSSSFCGGFFKRDTVALRGRRPTTRHVAIALSFGLLVILGVALLTSFVVFLVSSFGKFTLRNTTHTHTYRRRSVRAFLANDALC